MLRALTDNDLDSGDLIEVDEFVGSCIEGHFIDYDGFGQLVYENEIDDKSDVAPSEYDSIPDDVTHVLWFNR